MLLLKFLSVGLKLLILTGNENCKKETNTVETGFREVVGTPTVEAGFREHVGHSQI